jgi:ribonuclease BN (tRNA processing enzyme)
VRVTPIPSGPAGAAARQFLTTYLVNDNLAIDAGALGLIHPVEAQARVRHVVLTHSHIDHVATLPVFLDNVYSRAAGPVTVHATAPVFASLRLDLFNGRVWPDVVALSRPESPFVRLSLLEPGRPVVIGGLRVTPVPVRHAVPTIGVLIDDGTSAVLFSSDTAPADALWDAANATPHLKAVFLEASFPDELAELAARAMHLTPRLLAAELAKLRHPAEVFAVHIKPRYYEQVVAELRALGLSNVRIAEMGETYTV